MKTKTHWIAIIVGLSIITAVNPIMAEGSEHANSVDPKLKALNELRPILAVVLKLFPEATSTMLGKKFHFEDSTRLYVARAIAKVPKGQKPPLVEVRGPKQTGGVWCNIILLGGSSKPYARAEGATECEHFTEHIIYQDLGGIDHHLHVTFRVPKGKKHDEFVKEMKSLIQSYSHDFMTDK